MRRTITAVLGLSAVAWTAVAQADVTVLAVRLPAKDVAALARFYDAAFGLKQIDQVGQFTAAVEAFKEANEFYRSWKLRWVLFWLRFSPHLLCRIYNRYRPMALEPREK